VSGVLWVVGSGHGVSKWGQKSDRIGLEIIGNLSKICEDLVSVRHRTILGRRWRQGGSRDGFPHSAG
jgi:hypothetical protein